MKKLTLLVAALSMTVSTAFASNNSCPEGYNDPQRGESFSASEFFCGIIGGATAGLAVNKVGASTPGTFLGAILGGVIGVNFCKYLNDDSQVGAQAAAFNANLDANLCQVRSWKSSQYHGSLRILVESWNVNGGNGELAADNQCKLFETSIYKSNNQYVGTTKAWACKNNQGQWILTKENWISKKGYQACGNYAWPPRDQNGQNSGGSVAVGTPVVAPTPINVGPIRMSWGLEQFRRRINDYGYVRSMQLAVRTRYAGEVELGLFKALSDDGRSVIVYFDENRQIIAPIQNVGIECRGSGLCQGVQVTTRDGLSGELQYVFQNGDVVVNDPMNGIQLRPSSYIQSATSLGLNPVSGPQRAENLY